MPSHDNQKSRDRRQAVALRYDQEIHEAPLVTAKGSGMVAEKIVALAEKHGIPVEKDPELLKILMKLEINQEIPENVFQAVAEILALIYRTESRLRENRSEL